MQDIEKQLNHRANEMLKEDEDEDVGKQCYLFIEQKRNCIITQPLEFGHG